MVELVPLAPTMPSRRRETEWASRYAERGPDDDVEDDDAEALRMVKLAPLAPMMPSRRRETEWAS
jgi:hypothetical protein